MPRNFKATGTLLLCFLPTHRGRFQLSQFFSTHLQNPSQTQRVATFKHIFVKKLPNFFKYSGKCYPIRRILPFHFSLVF